MIRTIKKQKKMTKILKDYRQIILKKNDKNIKEK